MGTAVLLPQDCLRPGSKHRHGTAGLIFAPGCAPRSERSSLAPVDVQGSGLLPLPGYGQRSSPMNIPRRGSDTDHFKFRKAVGARERFFHVANNVPAYKMLQHPKQGDATVKLLAQFVTVDEVEVPEPHTNDGSKIKDRAFDTRVVKVRSVAGSACQPKDVSKHVNGTHTLAAQGYKLLGTKVEASKPSKVATTDRVHDVPEDSARSRAPLKPSVARSAGKVKDISCKAGTVGWSGLLHERTFSKGSTQLRRTSTEPQFPMHVLGQCRSNLTRISLDSLKPESQSVLSESAALASCQERWAGPAYSSSPSPSSLPLPKLCLPHPSCASPKIPPLVKQYSTSVYMQPFVWSSSPSKNIGAWDVAIATKSLREMLHLDPL